MADDLESHRILEQLQVMRAQTGDPEAFCQLFKRHNEKLLYYLRRLLNGPTEAEDTLQEVWLAVHRKIASLKDPPAFRTWLYRIARNHAVTRLRKEKTHVELTSIDESQLADDPEPIEDEFVLQYDAATVHEALNELSTNHREVLTLRFLEQLSYEEMAEIVGCSLGTIRSRIHYAKTRLKENLIQRNQSEKD